MSVRTGELSRIPPGRDLTLLRRSPKLLVLSASVLVCLNVFDPMPVWAAGAIDCSESVTVEVDARENIAIEESMEEARARAVRRALTHAVQTGSGVEVATSVRTITAATERSIRQETIDRTVMWATGRLKSWSIVKEEVSTDLAGDMMLELVVTAEVCLSPSYVSPLVVAFGTVELPVGYMRPAHRDRLAQAFPPSERIRPILASANTVYYDVLVDGVVTIEIETLDNKADIAVLERFRPTVVTRTLPSELRRVTVTAAVRGTRFFDEMTIIERIEKRRHVGLEADPMPATIELIGQGLTEAAAALHARLFDGDLSR